MDKKFKTDPDDKISPISSKTANEFYDGHNAELGLNKREYFAAMALQGLLTRPSYGIIESTTVRAVIIADSLIEQLNKQK